MVSFPVDSVVVGFVVEDSLFFLSVSDFSLLIFVYMPAVIVFVINLVIGVVVSGFMDAFTSPDVIKFILVVNVLSRSFVLSRLPFGFAVVGLKIFSVVLTSFLGEYFFDLLSVFFIVFVSVRSSSDKFSPLNSVVRLEVTLVDPRKHFVSLLARGNLLQLR